MKQVIREGDEPELVALHWLQSPMLLSKLGLIPTSLSQNRLMQLTNEPQAHSSGLYRNNPKLPGLTWYNSIVSHRGHHYEQGKDAFSLLDVSFGSWFYPWNTAQVPTPLPWNSQPRSVPLDSYTLLLPLNSLKRSWMNPPVLKTCLHGIL